MARFDYGSPVSNLEFQILWYGHDLDMVIGATIVKRRDLSAAIVSACNMLKRCRGDARDAHGFYVQAAREEVSS